MSEIDWDKAPEGATHYCAKGQSHNGVEYGEHWLKPGFYRMPHWKKWEEDKCRAPESILVARPSPAWSGGGLPPVGVMCEVVDGGSIVYGHGESGPVVAHVEDCAVVRMSYGLGCFTASYLRPIRTKEQIAADEREAAFHTAICDVEEKVSKWNTTIDCSAAIKATIDVMISLGYRKP